MGKYPIPHTPTDKCIFVMEKLEEGLEVLKGVSDIYNIEEVSQVTGVCLSEVEWILLPIIREMQVKESSVPFIPYISTLCCSSI